MLCDVSDLYVCFRVNVLPRSMTYSGNWTSVEKLVVLRTRWYAVPVAEHFGFCCFTQTHVQKRDFTKCLLLFTGFPACCDVET